MLLAWLSPVCGAGVTECIPLVPNCVEEHVAVDSEAGIVPGSPNTTETPTLHAGNAGMCRAVGMA